MGGRESDAAACRTADSDRGSTAAHTEQCDCDRRAYPPKRMVRLPWCAQAPLWGAGEAGELVSLRRLWWQLGVEAGRGGILLAEAGGGDIGRRW